MSRSGCWSTADLRRGRQGAEQEGPEQPKDRLGFGDEAGLTTRECAPRRQLTQGATGEIAA
ncbi:hypothetical protein ACFCXH_10520 [Streptomyces nojiriensis]|uniref:hypothetical protein n=1 Tax=Streptomyces nojiriensis TaxID=66374 RepID=UPI0035DDD5B4